MMAPQYLLSLSVLMIGGSSGDVVYRDLSVDVEGDLIDARMVQVLGDDRPELVLVTSSGESGKREIQIYTYTYTYTYTNTDADRGAAADALQSTPWRTISVFEDVVAYAIADVRSEPGNEILFFTRGGVFALSPQNPRLRGNVERLIETSLVYEVADPFELPFWEYILPGKRDLIVVPGDSTFSVWGPSRDKSSLYERQSDFTDLVDAGSSDEQRSVVIEQSTTLTIAGSKAQVSRRDSDASRIMLEDVNGDRLTLLSFTREYAAPGLADINGDGAVDLVVLADAQLSTHLASNGQISELPTRVEDLPNYFQIEKSGKTKARIELVDLDNDGKADLFVQVVAESSGAGLVADTHSLMFLRNDGNRLCPAQPDQLMRFKAMELRAEISDIDGDGVVDLVIRKFEVPSLMDVVSSLDFKHTTLLFLGTGKPQGRVFERRPVLKSERIYDEETVGGAIAQRKLSWDCSGDGIADLVEIDVEGRVGIRKVTHESGFFSGDTWKLERGFWKRFERRGAIGSLVVDDFNGDGLGDILSRRKDGVLLFFSGR